METMVRIAQVGTVYIPQVKMRGNKWPAFFIKAGQRMFVPSGALPLKNLRGGTLVAFETAVGRRPISHAFNVRLVK